MFARIVAAATISIVSLSCGGCLDYRENLVIRPDGSGRIEVIQEIDLETYEQIVQLAASLDDSGPDSLPAFDEATLRESLGDREGLILETLEVEEIEREGTRLRRLRLVLEFDRPERLRSDDRELALLLRPFTFGPGPAGDRPSTLFRRRIGIEPSDLQALIEDNQDEGDLDFDDDQIAGFRSLASQILLGKKAIFTVRMPESIASASPDTAEVEGERATWTFTLSDLFARAQDLELVASGPASPSTGDQR